MFRRGTALKKITPDMAQKWLDEQKAAHQNRPQKTSNVEYFERVLLTDQWNPNAAAFVFNEQSILVDGQHRAQAIVNVGVTVEAFIDRDMPSEDLLDIDVGSARTAADTLARNGEKYPSSLAGALQAWISYVENGDEQSFLLKRKQTPRKVLATLAANPNMRDSVSMATRLGFQRVATFAFLHYRLSQIDAAEADTFFDLIKTGLSDSVTSPTKVLHDLLVQEQDPNRDRNASSDVQRRVYNTWNLYRNGETITLPKLRKLGFYQPE